MASRVVLFVATTLMAVMTVAVTVRAVLASRNQQAPDPLLFVQRDTQQSFIVFNPRLQTPSKTLALVGAHIVFMPFPKFMPVCLNVCLCICLTVRLCVSTHFPLC